MKKVKKVLIVYDFVAALAVVGLLFLENNTHLFDNLRDYELLLIIFVAFLVISLFLKIRTKRKWKIIQPDDELSRKQKYKASYFAYSGSLFIMMFLIILAPRFSNPRSMMLGGLLLMIIIGVVSKLLVTIETDEKQD